MTLHHFIDQAPFLNWMRRNVISAITSKKERAFWTAALVFIAVHVLLAWLARPAGIETGHDDAQYLLLSRSLRSLGYYDVFQVGTPVHNIYPPGYPVMLAFWGALTGERFDLLVLLGIGASATALGLIFAVVKRLWSPFVALLCLAVLCVNPYMVSHAGKLMSEAPYMLLSVLALWSLSWKSPSPRLLVIAAAAAIGAALTRSIGVTLLVAIGTHWLLERRFAALATCTVTSAGTVGLWLLWTIMAPAQFVGRSYIADAISRNGGDGASSFAGVLLRRVYNNVPSYLGIGIPYHLPMPTIPGSPVDNMIGAVVTVVGLGIGLVVLFRRWRPAALYLLSYGALLALWPWKLARFVNPVLPLLVLAVLLGTEALACRVRAHWGGPAVLTLALLLTVNGAVRTAAIIREENGCERGTVYPVGTCLRQDQVSFFSAVEYINHRVPPEAIFLSGKPATLYYYTGRQTISREAAAAQDPSSFPGFMRGFGPTYVLLGNLHPFEPVRLAGLLEANCDALELEAAFPPRTYLFRVLNDGAPSNNGAACDAVREYRRHIFGDDQAHVSAGLSPE